MTTRDADDQLRNLAQQYDEYLVLSKVAEVPSLLELSEPEFFAPKPAPLTLTMGPAK